MKEKSLAVCLDYFKGLFDADDLELYKKNLNDVGIELFERDKTSQVMAFMDEFTNQVSLWLSNSLIQAYFLGLIANSTYDVLKKAIIWMWNSLPGKKLIKLQAGGRIEEKEPTFGLQIKIDKNTKIDFRLTGDVSDELKSKCIDKAFETMNTISRGIERKHIDWFASYSWESHQWIIVNVAEEIYKRLQK